MSEPGPRLDKRPDERNPGLPGVIPLGRWFGVPVFAHWSVAVAVALFADIIATSVLPRSTPGESTAAYWLTATVTSAVFFTTLLAHEIAHAVTARHYGMRVQKITLWMLGGMTELDGDPPGPRADAMVAASGPLTSLAAGAVCAALAWAVGGTTLVGASLTWLAAINVLLAVFNVLPGAPLDGGRLVRALIWKRTGNREQASRQAASAGRVLGFVLIGVGLLELLAGAVEGLWMALIGWFIVAGATGERDAVHTEQLGGHTVGELVAGHVAVAPDWWTVQQFLDQLTPADVAQVAFPTVEFSGQVSGAVTAQDLKRVPAERRADTRLRDVTHTRVLTVPADTELADLLTKMRAHPIAIVVQDGRPIGVLTLAGVVRTAQLAQLGWRARQDQTTAAR
jgi:Zn-dependent protease/CBS domain-containing protein